MPSTHIGGSFHPTLHPADEGFQPRDASGADAARPASSYAAGSAQSAQSAAAPVRADGANLVRHAGARSVDPANEPVLRLRGGGNAHPSGGKDDGRERLLPEQAGSSREHMYHGTQSGSEAQRATNEAKRHDLRRELEFVNRKLDDTRQKREATLADLDRINALMKDLENQKRQDGLDPARRGEIGAQLRTAQDDFWAKTREIGDSGRQMQQFDELRRQLERKLDKLRWT
ncbi:hypothetical protein [Paraburkholderia solisilvae]|uniref:Chromosome partition protein Smc n=1 Tax=Paraburkholderia solisilvae TaxID=624376 RepID=A0A6J5DYA3_9BURK|nr:hypothetical protein [Paraburkholderia solisilvae]CAB3758993.1 hypothetical protein LMG29739_03041 [Paraburkholderia solisilvae]